MRRLILLRHAKSDRSRSGERDHDRVLAKRGRGAAPRMGAYMASHGLRPDLVVCSTAVRARETWELVSPAFDEPPRVVRELRGDGGASTGGNSNRRRRRVGVR